MEGVLGDKTGDFLPRIDPKTVINFYYNTVKKHAIRTQGARLYTIISYVKCEMEYCGIFNTHWIFPDEDDEDKLIIDHRKCKAGPLVDGVFINAKGVTQKIIHESLTDHMLELLRKQM